MKKKRRGSWPYPDPHPHPNPNPNEELTLPPNPNEELPLPLHLTLTRRGAVHAAQVLLVLVQLFVTIGAFSTTIFLRQCRGALAHGLRDKGIDFDGAYSMA